jgi:hypothetical protein
MTLLNKILIFVGAALVIGLFGFTIYKLNEISNRQAAIETSLVAQKELADNIMRSQAQYATSKDIEAMIKANDVNLKAIQDDLATLHAEISSVNVILVNSTGQHATSVPSTGGGVVNPTPVDPKNPDPFGYMKKEQLLQLSEKFGTVIVPFGKVGFSAWQQYPWSVDISARQYKVVNVVGVDENQRNYFYNKFAVNVDNKDYEIKITSAETKQEFPEAKFSFWNPRLFLTAGGAVSLTQVPVQGSANAGVTLGIMSYGQYKTNPAISVLQLGVVYETGSQKPAAIINPVNFNIGGILPKGLANNTYLGPSLQVDLSGNVLVGGNMSIGF